MVEIAPEEVAEDQAVAAGSSEAPESQDVNPQGTVTGDPIASFVWLPSSRCRFAEKAKDPAANVTKPSVAKLTKVDRMIRSNLKQVALNKITAAEIRGRVLRLAFLSLSCPTAFFSCFCRIIHMPDSSLTFYPLLVLEPIAPDVLGRGAG